MESIAQSKDGVGSVYQFLWKIIYFKYDSLKYRTYHIFRLRYDFCDSLKELWNFDLKGNVIGAVQDAVNDETKGAVGIPSEQPYFNAGMLLIDVKNGVLLRLKNGDKLYF